MKRNVYYTGIDRFRLVAALLVVAIHTTPLAALSDAADVMLTRVAARVAVPFFFMATGFFCVSRYSRDASRVRRFALRTLVIYAAALLLYLPVNIYGGYFSGADFLPRLIFDLIFNGTMYHLWYLPAAVLGVLIAHLLIKRLDWRGAFAVAGVLYLVGLAGDSYYGLACGVPAVKAFYEAIFSVSEYTRNGVFFAPLFIVLGAYAADSRRTPGARASAAGFALSFLLMLGEGAALHYFNIPRHDSMYLMLVPCMWFLFCLLTLPGSAKNAPSRTAWLREASLVVYIVHPIVIVAVRLAARLLGLRALLVDNCAVQFAAVALISVGIGVLYAVLAAKLRARLGRRRRDGTDRAYIELNSANLSHNVAELRAAMPAGCELMAVVKTGAYGHGAYEVATQLERVDGVRSFAVATIDEGISLRRFGIRGEILVLGYTDVSRAGELRHHRLTQTVIDTDYAERLNSQRRRVHVHIKVDTGMHRLGVADTDLDGIRRILGMKYLKVDGVFSHLCAAESRAPEDVSFTLRQIERFDRVADVLRAELSKMPRLHLQSSYGLLNYPGLCFDYVRAGVALYGVASTPGESTVLTLDLRPVLSLRARVALVREVAAGESVGYDRAYVTRRDSRIAIIPIGYGDGVPRALSCGRGSVRIGGIAVPIVGMICMDQLAVDVTDVPDVRAGDIVTLIDAISPMTAPEVAAGSGSISNELLSRMGSRLPVVVK